VHETNETLVSTACHTSLLAQCLHKANSDGMHHFEVIFILVAIFIS